MSRLPWFRSILVLAGVGLIAGLGLSLIDRIVQIYVVVAGISPVLAVVVVTILVALVAVLGVALGRYVNLFQRRPQPKSIEPEISEHKVEAAEENLVALQLQVQKIQDEVAKRSLMDRSVELFNDLDRPEFQVVVFGVGSAGKTSLVNALVGQPVGEVGAPMGTTQAGQVYGPLAISGLKLPVVITDCPGILEAGVAGSERERMARQLATEADLLLFVVDDDLRRSEYEPLRALAEIGKRSVLVFNKIDRYSKPDREIILDRLRDRVESLIQPKDVVAIAALPAAITVETGETLISPPRIQPLLKRMVSILNREGDELVADNVLLRSNRLGDETRTLLNDQRQEQAEKVVERFQWLIVGAIFATPLPVIDLLATAAINAQMVVEIAKVYGCELNIDRGRELAGSLTKTLIGLGVVKGVMQIVTSAISITVVGYILKSTIQSITAAYLTRIAGKSFIEYFSRDQDWGDGGISEVVQRQFELNRRDEFIKSFIQQAVDRVMQLSTPPDSTPKFDR